jgi:hypothetical protein
VKKDDETRGTLDADIDALFVLPLEQFTAARNALATRLKKGGRANEAETVKALAKPPVSAWAVNQLYFRHRAAFEQLMAAGKQLLEAQTAKLAGRQADLRALLDARREALSELSQLAGVLLQEGGHSPTPDKMRRIAATLAAISANPNIPGDVRPGRLVGDVDPPGFELFAALPGRGGLAETPAATPQDGPVAAAKTALQRAESARTKALAAAQDAEAALQRAREHAKETERRQTEAEENLKKATAAAENALQRVQTLAGEAEAAAKALDDAERAVGDAFKALQSLSGTA